MKCILTVAFYSLDGYYLMDVLGVKVRLSPKCNQGSFCECTRVKCSFKSIITTKAQLLRFSFSGQNHFQWSARGKYNVSIKISIFKTVRRLDTTCHPGDTTSKVSFCVEPSYCFKNANMVFAPNSPIENDFDPKKEIQSILKVVLLWRVSL